MQSTLPSIVCILLVAFSSVICEQQELLPEAKVHGKFFFSPLSAAFALGNALEEASNTVNRLTGGFGLNKRSAESTLASAVDGEQQELLPEAKVHGKFYFSPLSAAFALGNALEEVSNAVNRLTGGFGLNKRSAESTLASAGNGEQQELLPAAKVHGKFFFSPLSAAFALGNALEGGLNSANRLASAGKAGAAGLIKTAAQLESAKLGLLSNLASAGNGVFSGVTKGAGKFAGSMLSGVGLKGAGEMVNEGANAIAGVADKVGSSTKGALANAQKYITDGADKIGSELTGVYSSDNDDEIAVTDITV